MGLIQRFDLKQFIEEYKLVNFVETGTFKGGAVSYALNHEFKKILSCEIQATLFSECSERFSKEPRVKLVHKPSPEFLRKHVADLEGNCLFWLDAHFPGAEEGVKGYLDVQDMEERLPLEAEIAIIAERQKKWKDVLIIDDMWIYEEEAAIPSGKLADHMVRHGFTKQGTTIQDINGGKNSAFIYEAMSPTHVVAKFHLDNGYFIVTPK